MREILDTDPMPRIRRATAEGIASVLVGWEETQQRAFVDAAIAEIPLREDALVAMGIQLLRLVAKALSTLPLAEEIIQSTIRLEIVSRYADSVLAPRLARAWYHASDAPRDSLAELRILAADMNALAREPGLAGGLLLLLGVLEIGYGSVGNALSVFERVPVAGAAPDRVSQFLPVFRGTALAESLSGLLLNLQLGWQRGAVTSLEHVADALAEEGREEDAARLRSWGLERAGHGGSGP